MPLIIATVIFSIVIQIFFFQKIVIGLNLTIPLILITFLIFIFYFFKRKISLLNLMLMLITVLPFIHLIPYLYFDFNGDYAFFIYNNMDCVDGPCHIWGLRSNANQANIEVINVMSTIGLVGMQGLLLGSLSSKKHKIFLNDAQSEDNIYSSRSLTNTVYFFWIITGAAILSLTASQENIFEGYHVGLSESFAAKYNLQSIKYLAFVIFMFAFGDLLSDKNSDRKKLKILIFISVFFFSLIVFQLMRGEREVLPFLMSFVIIFFVSYRKTSKINLKDILKGGIIVLLVLSISILIGRFRSSELIDTKATDIVGTVQKFIKESEDKTIIQYISSNIVFGPWSAALLTVESVSSDYLSGDAIGVTNIGGEQLKYEKPFRYYYGSTYINYIKSIPPNFVAEALGYKKQIDQYTGPAWEMRYGMGGTHLFVVPFLNFGIFGVFFIMFIFSYLINKLSHYCIKNLNSIKVSIIGTFLGFFPFWVWYGDKYIINCIILSILVSFMYRIIINSTARKI